MCFDVVAIPQQIYEREIEVVEASRRVCTTHNEYRDDVFRFYQWYFERGLLRLNRGQVDSFEEELRELVEERDDPSVEDIGRAMALKRLSIYDDSVENVRDWKNPASLYEVDTVEWAKGDHYCARCGGRYVCLCSIDYHGFRDASVGECWLEPSGE